MLNPYVSLEFMSKCTEKMQISKQRDGLADTIIKILWELVLARFSYNEFNYSLTRRYANYFMPYVMYSLFVGVQVFANSQLIITPNPLNYGEINCIAPCSYLVIRMGI